MKSYEATNPAQWSLEEMKQSWINWIENLVNDPESQIPGTRLILQVEENPEAKEIFLLWESLNPQDRVTKWKILLALTEEEYKNPLPACIQCGECCLRGSPTLHVDDLELLRENKIPWEYVYTLRRGEPVHNPLTGKPFFLVDERIKISEKPGTNECVFYDPKNRLCTIYENRPLQCRAQACWDISAFKQLEDIPYLTRHDIFGEIEVLMDIIAEHEKKCSFEKLHALFKLLDKNQSIANQIIELVSFESHFRSFIQKELNIPKATTKLLFGRSLENLLPLFGCKLEIDGDTKFLKVIKET